MSKGHTTEAFERLPSLGERGNIGIGFRPGNLGKHNRLKGNRNQRSKHKMRTHSGMAKT